MMPRVTVKWHCRIKCRYRHGVRAYNSDKHWRRITMPFVTITFLDTPF